MFKKVFVYFLSSKIILLLYIIKLESPYEVVE